MSECMWAECVKVGGVNGMGLVCEWGYRGRCIKLVDGWMVYLG